MILQTLLTVHKSKMNGQATSTNTSSSTLFLASLKHLYHEPMKHTQPLITARLLSPLHLRLSLRPNLLNHTRLRIRRRPRTAPKPRPTALPLLLRKRAAARPLQTAPAMPTNHAREDPRLDTIEMQRAAARRRLGRAQRLGRHRLRGGGPGGGREDHAGRAGRAAEAGGVADGRAGRGAGEGEHVSGGERGVHASVLGGEDGGVGVREGGRGQVGELVGLQRVERVGG